MRYRIRRIARPARASVVTGAALRDAKRGVREQAHRAARDALPVAARAAASEAHRRARSPRCRRSPPARTMLRHAAVPQRVGHAPRRRRALAAGKRSSSPRVDPAARMLSLHRIADLGARHRRRATAAFPSRSQHCASRRGRERSTGCWCRASRSTPAGGAWATAAATTTGCCRCCRAARRASPARSRCRSSTRVPAGAARPHRRRDRHRAARADRASRCRRDDARARAASRSSRRSRSRSSSRSRATAAAVLAPEIARTFAIAPKLVGVFVGLGLRRRDDREPRVRRLHRSATARSACRRPASCCASSGSVAHRASRPRRASSLLVRRGAGDRHRLRADHAGVVARAGRARRRRRAWRSRSRSSRPACRRAPRSPARCCPALALALGWRSALRRRRASRASCRRRWRAADARRLDADRRADGARFSLARRVRAARARASRRAR